MTDDQVFWLLFYLLGFAVTAIGAVTGREYVEFNGRLWTRAVFVVLWPLIVVPSALALLGILAWAYLAAFLRLMEWSNGGLIIGGCKVRLTYEPQEEVSHDS